MPSPFQQGSNPRELRKQFKKEPGGGKPPPAPEIRADISEILGLTAQEMMKDTVISDIGAMIERGYQSALEGYVLCLSRIIAHDTAWEYIVEAFRSQSEVIPVKYYKQFGKKPEDLPPKKGISVQ